MISPLKLLILMKTNAEFFDQIQQIDPEFFSARNMLKFIQKCAGNTFMQHFLMNRTDQQKADIEVLLQEHPDSEVNELLIKETPTSTVQSFKKGELPGRPGGFFDKIKWLEDTVLSLEDRVKKLETS